MDLRYKLRWVDVEGASGTGVWVDRTSKVEGCNCQMQGDLICSPLPTSQASSLRLPEGETEGGRREGGVRGCEGVKGERTEGTENPTTERKEGSHGLARLGSSGRVSHTIVFKALRLHQINTST